MTDSLQIQNKSLINQYRSALYDIDSTRLSSQLNDVFASDAVIHLASPIGDLEGPDALFAQVFQPLIHAVPDLERRDFIFIADCADNANWVGCCGYYTGVMQRPWLDIPPTRHPIHMRYHEFFRIEDGQVVEMQALWDIPSVMMQANAWPLAPSLGVEWLVPGPASQDGLQDASDKSTEAATSLQIVMGMLTAMGKHPLSGGPEVMELERYWHPKFNWYGPAGIGSMRGIDGFRRWHQIPFLKAMPDRRGADSDMAIFFAEGNYVGTTGWPNMEMTVSGDGWMGIVPPGKEITMRSLDFWRCENGLIRENWVLVDLLHVYEQIGVDVFERMREITFDRQPRS